VFLTSSTSLSVSFGKMERGELKKTGMLEIDEEEKTGCPERDF
jgi:hypothetical protein